MHILCTICSDLINQAENIYVTKCGHIFHHHCLAQWIERSKSCPQCRNKVTDKCMFRLYPTISNENSGEDAATLQSRLDDTQLQLRQQKALHKEKEEKLSALNADLKRNEELIKSYEKKLVSRDSAVSALKEQLDYVKIQNKETNRLKDENETLKKNIQTLNGLQKVLNATSEEVEQMLQGYTDVKTIATFATALKRALCESETKKNECRDRLHATKQLLAEERSTVAAYQAELLEISNRLAETDRKYKSLKHKRKASEMNESSPRDEAAKLCRKSASFDLNTAIIITDNSNNSLNSMVERIENAESPYLSLKQSSLALSALNRAPLNVPTDRIKPSEFAIINAARSHAMKKQSENIPSIFHRKQPIKPAPSDRDALPQLDASYDGLGGHSKLDTFPTPRARPVLKSCIPKLSAKHKLKRPSLPSGNQDIGQLLEKIRDK